MTLTQMIESYIRPAKIEALKAESQELSNRLAMEDSSQAIYDSFHFDTKVFDTSIGYTKTGLAAAFTGLVGIALVAVDYQFHDAVAKAVPGLQYAMTVSKYVLPIGGLIHSARNLWLILQLNNLYPRKENGNQNIEPELT